jgi:hypothetical protein
LTVSEPNRLRIRVSRQRLIERPQRDLSTSNCLGGDGLQQIQNSPSNTIILNAKRSGSRLQRRLELIKVATSHVKTTPETSNDVARGFLYGMSKATLPRNIGSSRNIQVSLRRGAGRAIRYQLPAYARVPTRLLARLLERQENLRELLWLDRSSALRVLELNKSIAATVIDRSVLAVLFKEESNGRLPSRCGGGVVEAYPFRG